MRANEGWSWTRQFRTNLFIRSSAVVVASALALGCGAWPFQGSSPTEGPFIPVAETGRIRLDYRNVPHDRSGLSVNQPVELKFDLYLPAGETWSDFDTDTVSKEITVTSLEDGQKVRPTVEVARKYGRGDRVEATVRVTLPTAATWILYIPMKNVFPVTNPSSAPSYGYSIERDTELEDAGQIPRYWSTFLLTTKRCTHVTTLTMGTGTGETNTITLELSEEGVPVSLATSVRAVDFKKNDSTCTNVEENQPVEFVPTKDGQLEASVRNSWLKCVTEFSIELPPNQALAGSFNDNLQCAAATFSLDVQSDQNGWAAASFVLSPFTQAILKMSRMR